MIIKNLDYILKDKLNISDCTPLSYRMNRSHTRSQDRSDRANSYDKSGFKKNPMDTTITDIGKYNQNVIYEDQEKLPKVC